MRKKLVVAIVLAALLASTLFAVSGCTPSVSDFTVILGKTEYEVDETFDFDGSKLYVAYSDGSKRYVNVTEYMIVDFDTVLSGKKEVTVNYRNKTATAPYSVKGNVKTKLRLSVSRGSGAECVITLKNVEFPVYALSFSMTGDGISKTPILLKEGWDAAVKTLDNEVSVILYATNGRPIEENVVLFQFSCGANAVVELSKITAASQDSEYVLPNAGIFRKVETNVKT